MQTCSCVSYQAEGMHKHTYIRVSHWFAHTSYPQGQNIVEGAVRHPMTAHVPHKCAICILNVLLSAIFILHQEARETKLDKSKGE